MKSVFRHFSSSLLYVSMSLISTSAFAQNAAPSEPDPFIWLEEVDGKALVAHAEAQLSARGCPKINLQVLDTNSGALAFWQSVGYEADAVLSLGKRL
jgi:hypothetical protein